MQMQRAKILIADDSVDDYTLLELSLREAGFDGELVWVTDGNAALEALSSESSNGLSNGSSPESSPISSDGTRFPNLVVLDHYLPFKNSLEILEALSFRERQASVPIVVLSSYVSGDDRENLTSAGVHSVFEKPADLDGFSELGRVLLAFLEVEG